MYKEDTIAAVATPPGEGGVAIIRLSGPRAEEIAGKVFARAGGKDGALRSRCLTYGTIRDPKSGEIMDEVLVALMRKPLSYTGEDVVEINCHGGPLVTRRLLQLILAQGARHADPGEFTRRAFLNGRIDLAQAEAILDLTQARTETGMKLALQQMHGGLSKWIAELREELLEILAQVEAAIDFPEEDIELLHRGDLVAKIESLREKITGIIQSYEWGRLFREGAKVCIAGRPNVGKSSLLNALLGEERVIVTAIPGTTRDVIEESINLGGLPVVLWDTAGIHQAADPVEKIGVEFSLKRLEAADAILVVLDGASHHSSEDETILRVVRGKKGLIVINKSDLPQQLDPSWVAEAAADKAAVSVSALKMTGLNELEQILYDLLLTKSAEPSIVLTNARHKAALQRASDGLDASAQALQRGLSAEFVTVELFEVKDGLEEVIGAVDSEDILERIFSKFCIGK